MKGSMAGEDFSFRHWPALAGSCQGTSLAFLSTVGQPLS